MEENRFTIRYLQKKMRQKGESYNKNPIKNERNDVRQRLLGVRSGREGGNNHENSRNTNVDLSEMISKSNDQYYEGFMDSKDMVLTPTTKNNEHENSFLGILDDCIQGLDSKFSPLILDYVEKVRNIVERELS